MKNIIRLGVFSVVAATLCAGELPPEIQAKFIKIITNSSGQNGSIACKDAAMAGAIKAVGCSVDGGSKFGYATSEAEVKALKGAGKLVICPKLDLLPLGGSLAIVEENGHPQIYLHLGNIGASGLTLSDTILKIGKRLN